MITPSGKKVTQWEIEKRGKNAVEMGARYLFLKLIKIVLLCSVHLICKWQWRLIRFRQNIIINVSNSVLVIHHLKDTSLAQYNLAICVFISVLICWDQLGIIWFEQVCNINCFWNLLDMRYKTTCIYAKQTWKICLLYW